jgi:calcineurin-like phosphoesterase family protein
MITGNLEKESLKQMSCNFYGHTHQTSNFYNDMPYMYHVGVDSHDGYPVDIDVAIEEMHQKVRECKDFLDEEVDNG